MKLYCVRDLKAGHYVAPFTAENHLVAVRAFENEVRNGGGLPSKFPEDFELFCVGGFDPETGTVNDEPNAVICTGLQVVTKEE